MSKPVIVLGWGSLIWDPQELKLKAQSEWQEDGPSLPIEFARISSRDRLTLVRKMDAEHVPVLWHEMAPELTLDEAVEDLRIREGCPSQEPIGFIDFGANERRSRDAEFAVTITNWAEDKGIDKVIWTDLGVKFKGETGEDFSPESAIDYLKGLEDDSNAKEYVEKAPRQIQTVVRNRIREELKWGNEPNP